MRGLFHENIVTPLSRLIENRHNRGGHQTKQTSIWPKKYWYSIYSDCIAERNTQCIYSCRYWWAWVIRSWNVQELVLLGQVILYVRVYKPGFSHILPDGLTAMLLANPKLYHVSNSVLFFTKYSCILIFHRRSLFIWIILLSTMDFNMAYSCEVFP